MPADYQVIDANGALVWGPTSLNRSLWVTQKGTPLLHLWVKTRYTDYGKSAIVRINGKQIGKIPPRPWVIHGLMDYDVVPIPFSSSLLNTGIFGLGMVNTLSITPSGLGGNDDYLLVDEIVLMTRS